MKKNAFLLYRKRMLPKLCTFLFLILFSFCAYTQEKSISGKITDSLGNGVPDVTIAVKGTTMSVKTNALGAFNVLAAKGAVLKVSHISYISQDVVVQGDAPISIILE